MTATEWLVACLTGCFCYLLGDIIGTNAALSYPIVLDGEDCTLQTLFDCGQQNPNGTCCTELMNPKSHPEEVTLVEILY